MPSLADALLLVIWASLTLYALLGGADFGGGVWDLLAGRADTGLRQRRLIEHAIGPVWEANHVWLIFAIVLCWTGFPAAFAAVASTLYIPLTLLAFGIIARGAAFAFRKVSSEPGQQRLFGAAFAVSSVATPFFLGAVAGGVASGRVPPGIAAGNLITSWWNPASWFTGALAVGVCVYLAAVYLCADARRYGAPELAEIFRRKAIGAGALVGIAALSGIAVLRIDAPSVYEALTARALPLVGLSAAAVAAVLGGWALAQYPLLLPPGLTVQRAAADPAVLQATLVSLGVGAALLAPSLLWLFTLFQRNHARPDETGSATQPRQKES